MRVKIITNGMNAQITATQIPNHLIEIMQMAAASINTVNQTISNLGCFLISHISKNKSTMLTLGSINGMAICNMTS